MFKVIAEPLFTAPVPISVPGFTKPVEVRVTFRHKTREQLIDWIARAAPGQVDHERLDEVIHGWEGMVDRAGEPVAYSVTALADLLNQYSPAASEFHAAYLRELTESKRKN